MADINGTPFDDGWRDGVLLIGAYGPVTIEAAVRSPMDYPGQVGAEVRYKGHRDDLVAAGCISSDVLARASYRGLGTQEEERTGRIQVSSKASKWHRGCIQVTHRVHRPADAAALPGFLTLFPEGLPRCPTKGLLLRLVVDNTRTQP